MDANKLEHFMERYEEVMIYTNRKLIALLAEQLAGNITAEQYFALRSIKKHGPCTSSMLCDWNNENRNAATILIDRLVSKGYVIRSYDPQDQRVMLLETTEKAENILAAGEAKIRQFVSSYLEELEEEELNTFIRIYEKIGEIVKKKELHFASS
jgi:DNA-binding MarR family transcriptional regulator